MASGTLVCTGDLTTATDGVPICSSAWMLIQTPLPFDPLTIDPLLMAQAFGAGFIPVAAVIAACRVMKALLDMIRK
jgi:hypothetical protein